MKSFLDFINEDYNSGGEFATALKKLGFKYNYEKDHDLWTTDQNRDPVGPDELIFILEKAGYKLLGSWHKHTSNLKTKMLERGDSEARIYADDHGRVTHIEFWVTDPTKEV